jgi:hypothetical protein
MYSSFYRCSFLAPSPPPDISPSLFGSATLSPSKRTDPTPVIIFGFPSSHSLLIIREYERYGQILEHFSSAQQSLVPSQSNLPPSEILHGGNWIRITYADPVSAARAVATNGQMIGGAYMIGVIYAPKNSENGQGTQTNEMEIDSNPSSGGPRRREDNSTNAPTGPVGERKMNVVKGESMFVKKDINRPGNTQVSWGSWAWNSIFGDEKPSQSVGNSGIPNTNAVVAGGGQSNFMVKAAQGLSEAIFGF